MPFKICNSSPAQRHSHMLVDIDCLSKARGGYFHQNRTWMCLPDLENLTISIPIFCLISHPSIYHFRKKSTQFWPNWMLFTTFGQKYTQFFEFGLRHLWWNPPPIAIPNFEKKRPKRQAHIRIPCQCENPPGVTRPHFYADLTANNPMFSSVHTQWPPYPLLYQILHTNCQFSCTSHAFWEI